jgi:hypothetical protein
VFGMTTPVLSVGEERGGFTGIFEIVAADKARVGRVKRRPVCDPYLTLGTLAAPIYLATLPAQGANGPESHGQPRVRHRPSRTSSRVLSDQTQPCWPSAAADLLRCDRVD